MCFSAPVSFLTSGVLATVGIAAQSHAKTRARKLIAIVPILFAIQQFIEGLQWLVAKPSVESDILTYGFLLFAFLLWPFYIPWAVLMNEHQPRRQKWMRVLTVLGLALVVCLIFLLATHPVHAVIYDSCIRYDINTSLSPYLLSWYVFVTVGSFALSSQHLIRWFGWFTAVSVFIAAVFYNWVFTSVWCFFAAVLSILMYVYLRETNKVMSEKKYYVENHQRKIDA